MLQEVVQKKLAVCSRHFLSAAQKVTRINCNSPGHFFNDYRSSLTDLPFRERTLFLNGLFIHGKTFQRRSRWCPISLFNFFFQNTTVCQNALEMSKFAELLQRSEEVTAQSIAIRTAPSSMRAASTFTKQLLRKISRPRHFRLLSTNSRFSSSSKKRQTEPTQRSTTTSTRLHIIATPTICRISRFRSNLSASGEACVDPWWVINIPIRKSPSSSSGFPSWLPSWILPLSTTVYSFLQWR